MKRRPALHTFCAVSLLMLSVGLTVPGLPASEIFAVTSESGTPVVQIDPSRDGVRYLFKTNAGFPEFGFGAFDPVSRKLYFLVGGVGRQKLVIADVQNRIAMTRSIAVPGIYVFLAWDEVTHRILSATTQPGAPVVAIDPDNGNVQSLFNTNIGLVPEFGLFDPSLRRLYLIGDGFKLITVDLRFGTWSSRAINSPIFHFIEWDSVNRRILALVSEDSRSIVAIDPETAAIQHLCSTYLLHPSAGISAFDPESRQLYFSNGFYNEQQLVAVDLRSNSWSTRSIATTGSYVYFALAPSQSVPVSHRAGFFVLMVAMATIGILSVRRGAA